MAAAEKPTNDTLTDRSPVVSHDASVLSAAEQVKTQRQRERESWDAFWKVNKIEASNNALKLFRHYSWRIMDFPATWARENIIEPLHDKYKWPYYHRKFNRVRDVDECEVGDQVCMYEADWQFRLDKMVDTQILSILHQRVKRCQEFYHEDYRRCAMITNDFEEADLNYYIKYGDLGCNADSIDCYMKQKHRMIWERRHPRLMQERAKAYQQHNADLAKGIFNEWFWTRGSWLGFKTRGIGYYRNENQRGMEVTRDDVSQDPARLKEEAEIRAQGEYVDPIDEYHPFSVWP